MASNFIQNGSVISLTMPYDAISGAGVLVGSIFGVATSTYAEDDTGQVATCGVWELAKVSAQAWAAGAKIYWDNTAKLCTTTSTSNTLVGAAVEAAANPSSTGRVRLNGTVS